MTNLWVTFSTDISTNFTESSGNIIYNLNNIYNFNGNVIDTTSNFIIYELSNNPIQSGISLQTNNWKQLTLNNNLSPFQGYWLGGINTINYNVSFFYGNKLSYPQYFNTTNMPWYSGTIPFLEATNYDNTLVNLYLDFNNFTTLTFALYTIDGNGSSVTIKSRSYNSYITSSIDPPITMGGSSTNQLYAYIDTTDANNNQRYYKSYIPPNQYKVSFVYGNYSTHPQYFNTANMPWLHIYEDVSELNTYDYTFVNNYLDNNNSTITFIYGISSNMSTSSLSTISWSDVYINPIPEKSNGSSLSSIKMLFAYIDTS